MFDKGVPVYLSFIDSDITSGRQEDGKKQWDVESQRLEGHGKEGALHQLSSCLSRQRSGCL